MRKRWEGVEGAFRVIFESVRGQDVSETRMWKGVGDLVTLENPDGFGV